VNLSETSLLCVHFMRTLQTILDRAAGTAETERTFRNVNSDLPDYTGVTLVPPSTCGTLAMAIHKGTRQPEPVTAAGCTRPPQTNFLLHTEHQRNGGSHTTENARPVGISCLLRRVSESSRASAYSPHPPPALLGPQQPSTCTRGSGLP
jgi:hypothetical protein